MLVVRSRRRCIARFWLILPLFVGCASPVTWTDVISLHPAVRRKWSEDEQYAPTFYAKREELRAFRDSAASMPPQRQDQLAFQLSELLRNEENPLLRREAVLTLGYLATPNTEPALRRALSDGDIDVRAAACRAWGRRGGESAPAVLAEVLGSDQDVDVRLAAVSELGRFRGPTVNEALAIALDDSDPALQYQAVQTLREHGDVDYGNSIYAWREYLRGNTPAVPEGPSIVERVRNWF